MRMSELWTSEEEIFKESIARKKEEISNICRTKIYEGFKLNIGDKCYQFTYDRDDQINLQDTMNLFDSNMIKEVMWTVRLNDDKVRIKLNKKDFTKVYKKSVVEKIQKMSHYKDVLVPIIEKTTTEKQLEAITWDTNSTTSPNEPIVLNEENTLDKRIFETNVSQAESSNEIIDIIMALQIGGM